MDKYNAPAYYNLGNAFYMVQKPQEAIKYYKRALELVPDSAECHFNLASAYQDIGDMENCKYHFEKSGASNPDARAKLEKLREME